MNPVDDLIQRLERRKAWPLGERYRVRTDAGVSLREMGAAVGVSFTAIKNYETGGRPRTPEIEDRYFSVLAALRDLLKDAA